MTPTPSVVAAFCITAEYYGRPISDGVAQMYAHDVQDLDAQSVLNALSALRRDPKRRTCPLPAEVRAFLDRGAGVPSAEQMAARIAGAVSTYGHTNTTRARAHLGEVAWAAVQDMGGWHALCRRLQSAEISTFTAQTRELCRVHIDRASMPSAKALPTRADSGRLQGMLAGIGGW